LATFLNGYLVEYLQVVTVFTLGGMLGVFVYLQWTRSEKEPLTERLTRRNLQEDLRASEERLNLVIEGTNDGIWDWDISTGKVFWSERANLLASNNSLGFGDSWDIIKKRLVVEDREKLEAALRGHLVGDVPFHIEVRLAMLDGKPRHLLLRGKAKRASDGKPSRMAGSVSDVTQRKSVEQELIYNAYHDSLTGVGNRKLFTDRLKHNIDRTIRRRDYLFSLLVLDVDNFKMINDTYGHSIGDKVLREIAMRIEDRCHSFEDRMVARIGGDVFGVLIGNVAKIEDIKSLVLRIEQDLSAPFVVENFKMSVSATIGIVFNGEKQESSEEMLSNADTVLQEAKRTPFDGRSRARVFDSPMRKKAQELYRLEQELRLAVENQDFFLVYQPIVNIQKGNRVVGFEALVRWNKDQGTEVQPCDFIPMAEDTGLILPMGKWILETACRQAKAWVDAGFHDVTVAVNFSARQFLNQDLANQVRCVLEETQLNPRNLKVEITESTAMREIERTIETLHSLTNMGLQISIDDFGTGYSNLSYLKHYPINTLKIDRSFVKDIPDDQEDMAITRTIISMANNLHLKIIAEGVETEAQLDFLRQEGCEQVQGYYFSRPLSRENATQYLKDYSSDAA
jgi:diguanylate cyclase (GGDEF)-like protein